MVLKVLPLFPDEFMGSESSVLVMFYAPWCGHCKRMKPEYVKAAASLKAKGIPGKLAAVDTTKERALGKRFDVKGFPTIVYFKVSNIIKKDDECPVHLTCLIYSIF